jgi:predicted Fe-Mo cluster-binding NifX family protein
MVKVAVPSDDGITIASHFGKCADFLGYDTEDGQVTHIEIRSNAKTACGHGSCESSGHHEGQHAGGHAGFVALLHDCSVVLCHGMGARAAEALAQSGITPLMAGDAVTAREAIETFLAGNIDATVQPVCRCHG